MKAFPNVKINLGLSILHRRDDGYHDLETLFVPYSGFHDELEIEESGDGRTSLTLVGGDWDPMSDLSMKAYHALCRDFSLPPVRMRLVKHAPVGAGLGSGSSDAAFTLKMLSSMFSLGLDDAALAGYASGIGSDCAFFIYNRPMVGRGRGELLSPYDLDLDGYRIEVSMPDGCRVSTREAYSDVVPRDRRTAVMPGLEEALSRPVPEWRDVLVNDFEPSVFAAHPEIAALKEDFYRRGAVYASMSGSGSAVFGIFRD